jgi:predicted nucleic acid-binding protein
LILADTNIISTFARVSALDFVRRLLKADRIYVTPATFKELIRAVEAGCDFLAPTLDAIQAGKDLDLLAVDREEILRLKELPSSLGAGEAESISVCLHRPGTCLLTNDKRAKNYCRERKIPCLDLPTILRGLWTKHVLTKQQVRELLRRIETEQGMVVKNRDAIFA